MPCCDTGRNIQKYKGAAASTLQDVTDNGNTTTGDIITTSGFFIGDGSKLTGISGASAAFTLQETTDRGNTTSNVVQFTNTITSLTTSGNVIVAGNVTASSFYGLGTGISDIDPNSLTSAVSISKGGTGSTTAAGAASALGVGTEDSPQFTGIKLGHASDTTLLRSSPGVVTIQGQTIRTGDVALGTQTSGNYVKTITAGDGLDMSGSASEGSDHTLSLDLKANHGLVIDNTELKIDLKPSGGLQFDSGQMHVKLDDTSINGTLPVSKGGTGTTTLDNLISLGSHTTGNYVKTVTAGNGLDISGSAGEGSDHTLSLDLKENHGLAIDNTELKIDLKASGGLEFDSGKLGVKLDDNNINGTLPVSKGGTGLNSSSGLTHGDILFVNSSGTLSTLPADSGKYLKSLGNALDPQWATVSEEAPATAGSLTAGDGLTSDQGTFNGSGDTVFSIDPLSGGGLVFDGTGTNTKKLKVDLGGTYITGAVAIDHGGTGATDVTGTGKNVLSVSPTLTGTTLVTNINASGTIAGTIAAGSTISGTTITASSKFVGDVNEASTSKNVFGKYISASTASGSKLTGQLNETNTSNAVYGHTINATSTISGTTITASSKFVGDVNEASTSKNVFGNTITAGTGGFVDSNFTNKGVIYVNSNGKLVSTAASTATGQVIKSDTNGLPVWGTDNTGGTGSSYWTQTGSDIYYNSGNVGIQTNTPQYELDVSGNVNITQKLLVNGTPGITGNVLGINSTSSGLEWVKAPDKVKVTANDTSTVSASNYIFACTFTIRRGNSIYRFK
jgi:hypothetical protein